MLEQLVIIGIYTHFHPVTKTTQQDVNKPKANNKEATATPQ